MEASASLGAQAIVVYPNFKLETAKIPAGFSFTII